MYRNFLWKLLEDFVAEVKEEGTYATEEELKTVVSKMADLICNNPDDTPEDFVEKIIEDNVRQLEDIRKQYPIPGYTVGVNIGKIDVKMYGGDIDAFGRSMPDNALFDIASMTKFYTQVIAYNLINEKVFSFNDKIKDLDDRFKNVSNLTVGDVLRFNAEFRTKGRLSEKSTIEEALDTLYSMEVVSTEKYNYNDMGMMLMKELMEKVTGEKFEKLVDKYIINKYGLNDTHLYVPTEKFSRLTGSPNVSVGKVNDPSALSVGGFSGHAGIFASSDDLIMLGKSVYNWLLPKGMVSDAYTPGIKENRGRMGNTYTSHIKGIDMSYVDRLAPIEEFAIQGSTRVQTNIGKNSVSTILLNPASMSIDKAKVKEQEINSARELRGQIPLSLVKHFIFDRGGKAVEYDLVDARLMAPSGKTVEPITTSNAELALQLRYLNKVIETMEPSYYGNMDLKVKVNTKSK